MRTEKLLHTLNQKQLEAVEMPRIPVLMLAGPGTGKTRTLIARIVYQIHKFNISPEHILALTFSNKATQEMQSRLDDILKEKADKILVSTIHSFCLSILRKYYQKAGLAKHFSICNDEYQHKLLLSLVADKVRSHKEKVIKGIQMSIDHHILMNKPLPAFSAMIYDLYSEHLNTHKLIDYNQILLKTKQLLETHRDIREQYSFLYQAIHVDEFQDTDFLQYSIIKMIAEKHRNIFVVADDDQSIYAWRGANPENIQYLIKDFSIAKPIFLDINYRSGPKIIDTACSLVKNIDRIEPEKSLKAKEQLHDSIDSRFFSTEEEELKFICEKISDWNNENIPYQEVAVIYPQHRFAEKLNLRLIRQRIPFQQASGRNFSDDPQMKKILLYLQLIRDPLDSLLLAELVEVELGYNTHKQIQNLQKTLGCNYRKALFALSNRREIAEDIRRQLNTFIGGLANLVNLKSFFSFNQLLEQIMSGMQNLDTSYIEEHAKRFTDFQNEDKIKWSKFRGDIWVFHTYEKLAFIAAKLLENVLPHKIKTFTEDRHQPVQKNDILILLSPMNGNLNTQTINLYTNTNEKRNSAISSLVRWCQDYIVKSETFFDNYIIVDLETTDNNPETCGIVEIAAVKVKAGQIIDTYQKLVNPEREISKEASAVHNISYADVKNQGTISDIWPAFKTFIGKDLLIAHNGYTFDFRILDRFGKKIDGQKLTNTRYDSLILARQIYPNERNSIDALAEKFKLDPGNRHRALDDVNVLHKIFEKILSDFSNLKKKESADYLFEYAALANFEQNTLTAYEDKVLFLAGGQKLLSPYSEIFSIYCDTFAMNKIDLFEKIAQKVQQLYPGMLLYNSNDNLRRRVLEMAKEFEHLQIDEAIAEFLSTIMLINPQDRLTQVDAVSLLTFHAAKGLEFLKVIIMGMEDENMPSFFAYKDDDFDDRSLEKKMDEQKRLLYVGLTRAKDEIIMTAVKNRFGRDQKSSPFLREILKYMKNNQ